MKIETDRAHIVSGVRHSQTIGSPIAILIENKDWKNWTEALPVEDMEGSDDHKKPVTRPRPGHADLAGAIKYNFQDARYILERASARETTARVAVGALAKALLAELGIGVLSHVIAVGEAKLERAAAWEELVALSQRDEVLLGCVDAEAEQRMKAVVDQAYQTGDTVGGVFEVVAHGVPPGLGSHIAWDTRLDGKLAQAIVSMQAVKGVEVGFAAEGAAAFGSKVQDTIHYDREQRQFTRGANRAGGLGRRHDQRPGHGGARNAEADFDAAPSARKRGLGDARTGAGGLRTQRCRGGAGGWSDRRGDGGDGAGRRGDREVRRRFAGGDEAQLSKDIWNR